MKHISRPKCFTGCGYVYTIQDKLSEDTLEAFLELPQVGIIIFPRIFWKSQRKVKKLREKWPGGQFYNFPIICPQLFIFHIIIEFMMIFIFYNSSWNNLYAINTIKYIIVFDSKLNKVLDGILSLCV